MKLPCAVALALCFGSAHACEELGELPVPGVYSSVAQALSFAANHYSQLYGDGSAYSIQLRIVIKIGFATYPMPIYKPCGATWENAEDPTPTPPVSAGGGGDAPPDGGNYGYWGNSGIWTGSFGYGSTSYGSVGNIIPIVAP